MWWFLAISAALSLAQGLAQQQAAQSAARSQRQAGAAAALQAQYAQTLAANRAKALEQRAGQERASAQRAAIEQRRQGDLLQQRSIARAAAGGVATASPSVVGVLGDIDTEAEYRALTNLYEGEESALGLEYNAQLERAAGEGELYAGGLEQSLSEQRARTSEIQGRSALVGGLTNAAGTVGQGYLSSGGSLFSSGVKTPTIAHSGSTLYSRFNQPYSPAPNRFVGQGGYGV